MASKLGRAWQRKAVVVFFFWALLTLFVNEPDSNPGFTGFKKPAPRDSPISAATPAAVAVATVPDGSEAMGFGRYKFKTMEDVIQEDPAWIKNFMKEEVQEKTSELGRKKKEVQEKLRIILGEGSPSPALKLPRQSSEKPAAAYRQGTSFDDPRLEKMARKYSQKSAKSSLIKIACGEIAGLAGKNQFESSSDKWKVVLRNNFMSAYKRLSCLDAAIMTRDDADKAEMRKLSMAQRQKIIRLEQTAIHAEAAGNIALQVREEVPDISPELVRHVEKTVFVQRGGRDEKPGLELVEKAEHEMAKKEEAKIVQLTEEIQKEKELAADEELSKRQQEQVERKCAKMEAQVEKLSKSATQKAAPFISGNKKLYRALIAPDLLLQGKIDAQRDVENEVHIFEHKARQRRLFKTVRPYEKIQCLAYTELIEQEYARACTVRCFLVETYQDEKWQREVKADPDLWHEVVENVREKAFKLQQLMRQNADVNDVRSWLDDCDSLSLENQWTSR
mmetsp:Transcript_54901/g.97860  ORF Transcript_54901/g.97860 Transcript_54901/m.97860 type:complete len:504 (-) Transcript_54901:299-1810(-)